MDERLKKNQNQKPNARVIAYYLPQFHPIPENDEWWGKGFTEWTNVTKAKPLFKGHQQPKLPADLGFYDLRVPEVREQQAFLAREAGIEGFCYWHYWFGNGKRILERIFQEVLESGKPDYPFCLGWANASWTGHWYSSTGKTLIEQTYGGIVDYTNHFYAILPALKDKRYIKVEDKPLILIFQPQRLPNSIEFCELWRSLAMKEGLGGVYFVAIHNNPNVIASLGMDGSTRHEPISQAYIKESRIVKVLRHWGYKERPKRFEYHSYVDVTHNKKLLNNEYPILMPNWDNTPRSLRNGVVFENSTPDLFDLHIKKALRLIENREFDKKIMFLKSWNEWAEGNYVEPDHVFDIQYLEIIKKNIFKF